jgi:hypothetical protein
MTPRDLMRVGPVIPMIVTDARAKIWRRACETELLPLEDGDPRLETDDPQYANLGRGGFPRTETLR